MKFTVVRVFKDVNMSYQHDGLRKLASSKRVNLQTLGSNELVVFLNAPLTAIKVFTPDGGLHYYRPGGRLNLEMISKIPKCFNPSGTIDFEKANKMGIEELLKKQEQRRPIGLLLDEKAS